MYAGLRYKQYPRWDPQALLHNHNTSFLPDTFPQIDQHVPYAD